MKIFKEIENKEKSPCLLKERCRSFLRRVEKILLREMKEQDLRNFWNYLGSLKMERNREGEAKIFFIRGFHIYSDDFNCERKFYLCKQFSYSL